MRLRSTTLAIIVAVVLLAGGVFYFLKATSTRAETAEQDSPARQININLTNGLPVPDIRIYQIKVGTTVQVALSSTKLGRVAVPLNPPLVVELKSSPLIFHFTVPSKQDYPMTFEVDGTGTPVDIGTIRGADSNGP